MKDISKIMINTGALIAEQIDCAALKNVKNYKKDNLKKIITEGKAHIGRMLHYFLFTNKHKQV